MSLYQRLRRRLGYETTTTKTDTRWLYKYTITHLNGATTTVTANRYTTDGAFATFQKITKANPYIGWDSGIGGVAGVYEDVRVLEGIQEIEKERIGRSELEVVVDLADGTLVEESVSHGTE